MSRDIPPKILLEPEGVAFIYQTAASAIGSDLDSETQLTHLQETAWSWLVTMSHWTGKPVSTYLQDAKLAE